MSSYVNVKGPNGIQKFFVAHEDDKFIYTSFGTFWRKSGKHIVDERFELMRDQYGNAR
jgi:hypothetical protein